MSQRALVGWRLLALVYDLFPVLAIALFPLTFIASTFVPVADMPGWLGTIAEIPATGLTAWGGVAMFRRVSGGRP